MKPFDVVILVAHPDDAFIGAGGIIFKSREFDQSVLVVTMTKGENQNSNTIARSIEFNASIEYCKVSGKQMEYPDGKLKFHLEEICDSIFHLLLDINPRIIITHSCNDPHSDHQAVFEAVDTATELLFHTLGEECHLEYLLSFPPVRLTLESIRNFSPSVLVDVSNYIESKKTTVLLHSSQMPFLKRNLDKNIALCHFYGALESCDYAEGYTYKRYKGLDIDEKTIFSHK